MSSNFEAVVAALWASLGLPSPRIGAKAEAVLTVDGRAITLAMSPDERHVVISAEAGPLSADLVLQDQQLRRLLRESLGLLPTNRAGLRLRTAAPAQPGDPVAGIEAIGPCRVDAVAELTHLVEDVLQLLDIHATTLSQASERRPGVPDNLPVSSEESLIFRL
jgi:hypothetical protein